MLSVVSLPDQEMFWGRASWLRLKSGGDAARYHRQPPSPRYFRYLSISRNSSAFREVHAQRELVRCAAHWTRCRHNTPVQHGVTSSGCIVAGGESQRAQHAHRARIIVQWVAAPEQIDTPGHSSTVGGAQSRPIGAKEHSAQEPAPSP